MGGGDALNHMNRFHIKKNFRIVPSKATIFEKFTFSKKTKILSFVTNCFNSCCSENKA
jgi:hypothetical protein